MIPEFDKWLNYVYTLINGVDAVVFREYQTRAALVLSFEDYQELDKILAENARRIRDMLEISFERSLTEEEAYVAFCAPVYCDIETPWGQLLPDSDGPEDVLLRVTTVEDFSVVNGLRKLDPSQT